MFKEINIEDLKIDGVQDISKKWTLITAKKDDQSVNTLTASWGAVGFLWNKPIYLAFIRPERFTHEFVENSKYYSVCFFNEIYRDELKYLGTHSGRDENKVEKVGFHLSNDQVAPYFSEANLVIICKKLYSDDFKPQNFADDSIMTNFYEPRKAQLHTCYYGEIIKVLKKEE